MSSLTSEQRVPKALIEADNLPSLPAVALEVLRLTQQEDSTIEDLAACLSRDPALAAKILKLANSSLFTTGAEVCSLERATMILGLKTVKVMALSFSLAETIPRHGTHNAFDFTAYWERSITRSVAARAVVDLVGSRLGDEAFLCGLLGHFGRLVTAHVLEGEYAELSRRSGGWPSIRVEEEALGFTNLDVCGILLKNWGLPEIIYTAVACWHDPAHLPEDALPTTKELVDVLVAANLAEEVLCSREKRGPLDQLREFLETRWEKTEEETEEMILGMQAGIDETAAMLSVPFPSDRSVEDILSEAKLQIVAVSLDQELEVRQERETRERLSRERETLISKATTDALTGLPNRAQFDEFLESQIQKRLDRSVPRALGLAMIDVDNFKSFNDTYGHQAGDEVLRRIGRVLASITRKGDLAARYGGEEFALISPETNPFNMRAMCERVRKAIEAEALEFEGRKVQVTASFGAACIAKFASQDDRELLMRLADSLLYRAKENGRNRVEVYKRITFMRR